MGTNGSGDTARRKAGDRDGTKALIGVLLAAPHPAPPEAVLAGIDAAVALAGRAIPDLGRGRGGPSIPGPWAASAAVVPDVPAAAGVDDRPVPAWTGYDDLLQAPA